MSDATTEAGVEKPAQKNYHDTMNESVAKMKLTFGNASLPEIFAVMVTVGYTQEKIAGLQAQVTELEQLMQTQTTEYAEQYAEKEKFESKRYEINTLFSKHRALLRIRLKGNVQAWVQLKLDGEAPKAFSDWYQQVDNFYSQLLGSTDMLTQASTVGITAEVVNSQKAALPELQALKESLQKETAEAQAATDLRDLRCTLSAILRIH